VAAAPPAEQPPVEVRDTAMVCGDGVRLATRIWQPAGPGPWPVLLMRQPYGRAIASTVAYAHPHWYASRGFLVAVQDVRGRGDSEGRFSGFAGEAADGAAAVLWARSLPGASGRVGTYGFSYQGLSQLLNSGSGSALPDCLVPAMAGLDERRHWASEGGAHWWGLGLAWALQLAAEGCRRRGDDAGWWAIRRCLGEGHHAEQGLALLERHDPEGMGLGWLRSDPADGAAWRRHQPPAELLRRPMLLIGGWHDPHLVGVLDLHRQALRCGAHPALVIGPWTHLGWGEGIDGLQLAFFRRHLLPPLPAGDAAHRQDPPLAAALAGALEGGVALAGEEGEAWFDPEGAAWHAAAADRPGPHGSAPEACWSLHSDGRAAICSTEGLLLPPPRPEVPLRPGGLLVLVHDPWRPVPARGGHLGLPPGAVERGDLDARPDVACFTTPPLESDLCLLGRPVLTLEARADQPGFDLCVALSRLPAAGGQVLQRSTGVLRVLGPQAQVRRRRRVELQPLALTLAAGERLRLSIAAAAWPAIAVNPGDGSMPRGPSGPGHRVISLEICLAAACLRLEPLLPAESGAD